VKDFPVGADPEFVFLDKEGALIYASDYLEHNGPLGCDGHHIIAEMRPQHGTPEHLVADIRSIMNKHRGLLPPQAYWVAGTRIADKDIGGHIHFGLYFEEVFATVLDGKLSQLLTLLEDRDEAIGRRCGNYGGLRSYHEDSIRSNHHIVPRGGKSRIPHFEYRTPASFIVSPTVSLGVYALAKSILWEEVNKGPYRLARLKGEAAGAVEDVSERAYRDCDKEYFRAKLPTLWRIIRRHQYWRTAEGRRMWPAVAHLKQLIDTKETWHNGYDMLERWRIIPVRPDRFDLPTYHKRRVTLPVDPVADVELFDMIWGMDVGGPRVWTRPAPALPNRQRVAFI
jgi:hypothetical protein